MPNNYEFIPDPSLEEEYYNIIHFFDILDTEHKKEILKTLRAIQKGDIIIR